MRFCANHSSTRSEIFKSKHVSKHNFLKIYKYFSHIPEPFTGFNFILKLVLKVLQATQNLGLQLEKTVKLVGLQLTFFSEVIVAREKQICWQNNRNNYPRKRSIYDGLVEKLCQFAGVNHEAFYTFGCCVCTFTCPLTMQLFKKKCCFFHGEVH